MLSFQALFTTYQNWWVKVDAIFERSGSVAPIKAKQKALEPFQTMRALCSYKTNDVSNGTTIHMHFLF